MMKPVCVRKKSCATEISCWLQTGICVTTSDGICMANWHCAENQHGCKSSTFVGVHRHTSYGEGGDIPSMEGVGTYQLWKLWGHTSYGGERVGTYQLWRGDGGDIPAMEGRGGTYDPVDLYATYTMRIWHGDLLHWEGGQEDHPKRSVRNFWRTQPFLDVIKDAISYADTHLRI